MGRTIILIAAFIVASVNAGFVWQDDDDIFGKHKSSKFPKMTFPAFPGFLPLPNFPTIPQLTFKPIRVPSPEEIISMNGPNSNAIYASSQSSSTLDKDGKVVRTGGATIISNQDGKVEKITYGDNPPNVISKPPMIIPQVPFSIPIPFAVPMPPKDMKTYKPGKNEKFVGSSSSSFSHSSNINGVESSEGGTSMLTNVNGDVDEKNIIYGKKPKKV